MRKTIARRLTESKQQVPHFYLTVDCEIDKLLALRKTLNERGDGAYKLSVNDLVIKAAAIALRRVPKANASWTDEGVKLYKSADIAVAVAIDGGLITPVVRQAHNKGMGTISSEMKELSARARNGKEKIFPVQAAQWRTWVALGTQARCGRDHHSGGSGPAEIQMTVGDVDAVFAFDGPT